MRALTGCDTSGSPEPLRPLDELYASDPSEFVATRDRLVRELKAAGETEAARDLAKRKKPTRAAHTLNQLARNHADQLAAYLDLSGSLREAQIAAGRDDAARDALRSVDHDRRTRLAQLLEHVEADRDDAERALTTALSDAAVAAVVRSGTLEKIPNTPSGFDAFAGDLGDVVPPQRAAATRKRRDAQRQLDDEIADARREVKDRDAAVRRARAALEEAERHAASAARALERLEERRDRLSGA